MAAQLSPTARRLLEAARQLLTTDGFDSLSFEAIGRTAGVTGSLIRYHFGDKAGLLVTLLDWLMYEDLTQLSSLEAEVSSSEARVDAILEIMRALITDTTSSTVFFDLLPRLLRDESAHSRLAGLYAEYRRVNSTALVPGSGLVAEEDVSAIAALTIAIADGLSVQQMIDSDAVDTNRALALWEACVRGMLSGDVRAEAGRDVRAGECDAGSAGAS